MTPGTSGPKPRALHRLPRRQRERAHGAPVEAAEERDELVAPGGIARQLDGALRPPPRPNCRTRRAARTSPGRDLGQLLGQRDQLLVIEIRARHVDQPRGLLLDRLHHLADGNGPWPPPRCPALKSRKRLPSTSSMIAPSPFAPPADSTACRKAIPLSRRAR